MTSIRLPQVVTVALNPALDQTIEVAGLCVGAVNRAVRMQVDVGGKAINVASCLADFGVSVAVVGQLGRDLSLIHISRRDGNQNAGHRIWHQHSGK